MPNNIHFDLELILLLGALVTGFIWLVDKLFFRGKRRKRALEQSFDSDSHKVQTSSNEYREPWFLELSKSFFPILLIVLVLRSFVAEPFRIPSGSMMPTLLHGDFILVNKFAYGIRLPVLHNKVFGNGLPQRGDVAVFRFPKKPSDDYIKRVIGLPGDTVEYRNKTLFINGEQMLKVKNGIYTGTGANSGMNGSTVMLESLEDVKHDILIDQNRPDRGNRFVIPDEHYFVMGDNRDYSSDSRRWGFVPEENLVGRAFLVWMNWDFEGKKLGFERIGQKIK